MAGLIASALISIFANLLVHGVHAGLMPGTISRVAKYIDYTQEQIDVFVRFKTLHGKRYKSIEEEAIAVKNLVNNLAVIDAQNEKFRRGETKFKAAIWVNSDLSSLEFLEGFTGYVLKPTARLYGLTYSYDPNLPEYLNYVEQGFVTKVQNQGFCGCCWAFSVTGALEAQFARKTGTLVKVSEQNLVDCNRDPKGGGPNWGCKGGNMIFAYEYLIKNGINPASSYPYRGRGRYQCHYNAGKSLGKVYDFMEIESNNETALMYALNRAGGPIAVAIDASDPTFQNYQTGVYDFPECVNDPNHAVVLVGYGIDSSHYPPVAYWLLKNSWGEEWGEKGYFRLLRNANNLCRVAMDASYPIVA